MMNYQVLLEADFIDANGTRKEMKVILDKPEGFSRKYSIYIHPRTLNIIDTLDEAVERVHSIKNASKYFNIKYSERIFKNYLDGTKQIMTDELNDAFNLVVKNGFCSDCRHRFESRRCVKCDCYVNSVKPIKEALEKYSVNE